MTGAAHDTPAKPTVSRRRDYWEMVGIAYGCALAVPVAYLGLTALGLPSAIPLAAALVAAAVWFCFIVAAYLRHPIKSWFDWGYGSRQLVVSSQIAIMSSLLWLPAVAAGWLQP